MSRLSCLATLIAILFAGVSAIGCGSGESRQTIAHAALTGSGQGDGGSETDLNLGATKVDRDHDEDGGAGDDTSNVNILDDGKPGTPSETTAAEAAVKHYYAAASAEDGAKACSLLYSSYAEAVPEDYGQTPPGPTYMTGRTCPEVMTHLFEHFHSRLMTEAPLVKVVGLDIRNRRGAAVLSFGRYPDRKISVALEGQSWRLAQLLDAPLP